MSETSATHMNIIAEITSLQEKLHARDRELHDSSEKFEKLLEVKNKLLTLATHDIRSPLTALRLATDMLERQANDFPAELKSTVDMLSRNIVKMEIKINSVSAIVKFDGEDAKLELDEHDLNDIVKEAIVIVIPGAIRRGIEMDMQLCEAAKFIADDNQLTHMTQDIIETLMDRLEVGDHILVSTHVEEEAVVVSVKASRAVMMQKHAEEILENLQTGVIDRQIRAPLYLAHRVAVLHEGEIKIECGDETNFAAWLPKSGPKKEQK